MQNWKRIGHLFAPDGKIPWMRSHAANPFAMPVSGDTFRIYFSTRDDRNRSSIAVVELDIYNPQAGNKLSAAPLVAPGEPGAFDDSGLSLGCVCDTPSERRLYYLGWSLGLTVPFTNFIGLAAGDAAADNYHRVSRGPILDRSDNDPLSLSYPFVLKEELGFRLWYGSTTTFGSGKSTEEMDHVIKTAVSIDGIDWRRDPAICIGRKSAEELGISKPSVIRSTEGYRMWYSWRLRARPYSIGYAESVDGVSWQRLDQAICFSPAPAEWETQMVCYPHVFEHRGRLHMLYCGNGYGRTGFGLAVLD